MVLLVQQTQIAAPVERVFDLSRSIDLHLQGADRTNERAVAGTTTGLIGLGETVTWQGRHFGIRFRHTSRITALHAPDHFQDAMISGVFRSFIHDHFFEATETGTLMRDELRFTAPLGVLGRIAESLFLRKHMDDFLRERNEFVRQIAESGAWRQYLSEPSSLNPHLTR